MWSTNGNFEEFPESFNLCAKRKSTPSKMLATPKKMIRVHVRPNFRKNKFCRIFVICECFA
eukprot:UN26558